MKTLKLILAAIGKFLHYSFSSQLTIGVFGIVELLSKHYFWGVVIIIWGLVLTITKLVKDEN